MKAYVLKNIRTVISQGQEIQRGYTVTVLFAKQRPAQVPKDAEIVHIVQEITDRSVINISCDDHGHMSVELGTL